MRHSISLPVSKSKTWTQGSGHACVCVWGRVRCVCGGCRVRTYSYKHAHTRTYTHIHAHSYAHTHTHPYSHTHTHIHTYSYTHTHTYIQLYTHTHTYMRAQIHMCIMQMYVCVCVGGVEHHFSRPASNEAFPISGSKQLKKRGKRNVLLKGIFFLVFLSKKRNILSFLFKKKTRSGPGQLARQQ